MKPHAPTPPLKPKRRPPASWRGAVRKYGIAVGELIWAANRAQASFGDLFSVLVDRDALDAGMGIWFSIQTDNGQRAALQALLRVRAKPESRLCRNAQWAIAATEKLAEIRNDAAHMATSPAMSSSGTMLALNPLGNTATRLARRDGNNFLQLFAQAKGDYVQIQQYVHEIFCHLAYPDCPLPLRPQLSSVIVRLARRR